ncbi:DUF3482 domain-containing protein [Seongchinamella unica]|uniref:DUF3482 domain-containing protein n=1 Tax=Seongchinamella unica TaxID=2547392 RepID=A0A4R5LRQ9_9GAMM|nr:DUF3482 domain-containing protein [Seongchinamella unica]TDG13407.1 DUF3482 domain-containing protein [Seongchinamella unica]
MTAVRRDSLPSFAVVGRPNKGKSSIVATLARDDSVRIAARAGSTRSTRRFPMQVDGEVLYELIDTPGMQRSRQLLAWLQSHCNDAASRPAAVKRFLQEHGQDEQFADECRALQPIVEGAGIIYVVDGSVPFGADYEAEMEILRWTGRPSLALVNPIENTDYVEQWITGLGQYFQTVRSFDAHRAEHSKQLDLLTLFGHLDPQWRQPLRRAVQVLEADRLRQHQESAELIAGLICEGLTYRVEQAVPEGAPEAPVRQLLFSRYQRHLIKRERECRTRVEELFYYHGLNKSEQAMDFAEDDLFHQQHWYLWGLNRRQLLLAAGAAGGVAGGGAGVVVDGMTGGLLGGLATMAGGIGGAIASTRSAIKYSDDIARWSVKGIPTGGNRLSYGPSRNVNFPFVLLGRAMQHHRLISQRTHAVRESLKLTEPALDWLSDRERRQLARVFEDLRGGKRQPERRAQLSALVQQWCQQVDAG